MAPQDIIEAAFLIAKPEDVHGGEEYAESSEVLMSFLPRDGSSIFSQLPANGSSSSRIPIGVGYDMGLVTRVICQLQALTAVSNVPLHVWEQPMGGLLEVWKSQTKGFLEVYNDSEHAMDKMHEAGLIPLVERQIRFAYASHPVHQSMRIQGKPNMLMAALSVLPSLFGLSR
jgi:hypothetical protein